ncbi:MAG: bifunctional DNA-formamidopyrimidine glycosylase/DNA-(apurinic or apyrimidinic site) lyase, partial [Actinomycetota bacterium]
LPNVAPGPHDHVLFVTDDGTAVTFTDPRRFGLLTLCEAGGLAAHPLLAGLGPEPLEDGFTAAVLAQALAGRAAPIKAALLDQTLVAGLGNIYVCESLFRARIHPTRPARSLKAAELKRLHQAIREVLAEAIAAGGSTLRDHMRPDGELGYFQHNFAVYGREGQPCRGCDCQGGTVERMVQSGRSTFYCAKRQA